MTKERKMAVASAGLIVVAVAASSAISYVEGAVHSALIVVAGACFLVGVCLYGYTIRDQLKQGKK